jgi:hypothetical protein
MCIKVVRSVVKKFVRTTRKKFLFVFFGGGRFLTPSLPRETTNC